LFYLTPTGGQQQTKGQPMNVFELFGSNAFV
jgi:hypothetical protein